MNADWLPLEQMVGPELCHSFMFMGRWGEVYLYKHIDTRRYLNISLDGRCFRYSANGYSPIELEDAIQEAAGRDFTGSAPER